MVNSLKSNAFQLSKPIIELDALEITRETGRTFPSRALKGHRVHECWCEYKGG